ncbi:MAG: large subunit ribosomal protein L25 [Bacteroidia bacterium]|jgi:large subunit ribosomal protein L25
MKTIALKGEKRENTGKAVAKQIRAAGMTPCVLYGSGVDNAHFSVYEADFKNLVFTPNTYLVRLDIDGHQVIAKLQDIQFHPVSEAIIHADFYAVDLSLPLTIAIPTSVVGNAIGVRNGGKLRIKMKKLLVRGLVNDLPETIEVNVDALKIGKSIRVRDISVTGFELLDTPENSVVSVVVTRAAKSAEEELADEEAEAAEAAAAADDTAAE